MPVRDIYKHIGQFAIVGFDGQVIPPELRALVRQFDLGGVIFFARNIEEPEQVAELSQEIQSLGDDLPLWVSIDQEGGRVQRFDKDFVSLPSLGDIGKIYKKEPELGESLAKTCAWVMATELISYDIDLSFAPVIDLQNMRSDVIGDRSFSSDPDTVIALAKSYIFLPI